MNKKNESNNAETHIREILKGSYDLHIHCGPENMPRKYTPRDIGAILKVYQMRGAVLKSHIQCTAVPIIQAYQSQCSSLKDIDLIPSITLNWYVGGIRVDPLLAAKGTLTQWNKENQGLKDIKTLVVWFPTIHSTEHLASHHREIPKSWTENDSNYCEYSRIAKKSRDDVCDIRKEVYPIYLEECEDHIDAILDVIAENNYILATGHISPEDSRKLVKRAFEKKVKKVIVTHPVYREPLKSLRDELKEEGKTKSEIRAFIDSLEDEKRIVEDQQKNQFIRVIGMEKEIQKELAQKGAYIEACYAMHSIDHILIEDILGEIEYVGPEHFILTSDLGQTKSDPPPEGLMMFCKLLVENERSHITLEDIKKMLHDNPRKLIEVIQ